MQQPIDVTPVRPIFLREKDGLTFEPDVRPGLVRCSRCLALLHPRATETHQCEAPRVGRSGGPAPPTIVRIAHLEAERAAIYRQLGYGGIWRANRLDRLADVQAALAVLWDARRREEALRRAGGRPRNLGPADAKTHRSRRII